MFLAGPAKDSSAGRESSCEGCGAPTVIGSSKGHGKDNLLGEGSRPKLHRTRSKIQQSGEVPFGNQVKGQLGADQKHISNTEVVYTPRQFGRAQTRGAASFLGPPSVCSAIFWTFGARG